MVASEKKIALVRPSFNSPVKLLIVVAPYYKEIADQLVLGAQAEIENTGGLWELVEVPGALEIPTAIAIAQRKLDFDGFVALGCVIKGETPHFDFISQASINALMQLSINNKKPIGNGIITCLNKRQAQARKKKGAEAAKAVISILSQK